MILCVLCGEDLLLRDDSIAVTVAYPVTGTNSSSNFPCALGCNPLIFRTRG